MTRPFQFKQFSIQQERAPMKVGTDGVLLGAWTTCDTAKTILDVGTGTGLIALMLAQRNPLVRIDAAEINRDAFLDAVQNISSSPWKDRIDVHLLPVQKIKKKSYDLIVSNPPYFKNDLRSVDNGKKTARHDDQLNIDDLIELTSRLNDGGIFSGILPIERFEELREKSFSAQLKMSRLCKVFPTSNKPPHRILFEFKKTLSSTIQTNVSQLTIEEGGRHIYSDDYKKLTSAFYLKL